MRIATLLETPLSGWPDSVDVQHAKSLSHLVSLLPGREAILVDSDAAGGAWIRRARRIAGDVPVLPRIADEAMEETLARLQDAISIEATPVPETLLVVSVAPFEALEVRHPDALWLATTRPAPSKNAVDATQVPFQPSPRAVSPLQLEALVFRTIDAVRESGASMVVVDDLLALSTLHSSADLIRFINYLSESLRHVGAGLEIGVRPDAVAALRGHVHADIVVVDGDALPLPDDVPVPGVPPIPSGKVAVVSR